MTVDKKKVAKKRPARQRQINAVEFTIWATDGSEVSEEVIELFQAKIEEAQMEVFFQGHRILTQTTRA